MRLLSLSTAEQGCSLAIMDGRSLLCEEFWSAKLTHSRRLVKMIEHMLENRAGMTLEAVDGFVVAQGPGSFTGVRIGISVIKGFAYAMGKPASGVSSLDGIAFRFVHSSCPVCVMMDARRNEVYSAVYQFDGGLLVSKSEERVLSPRDAVKAAAGPAVFAGSGSKAYRDIIEQTAQHPVIAHEFMDGVSAAALVRSLPPDHERCVRPGDILTPSYIRKSDAELQFAEKPEY